MGSNNNSLQTEMPSFQILAAAISISFGSEVVPLLNVESIESCTNKDPVDCAVTTWTSWSTCPTDETAGACGSPKRTRTRSVVVKNSCGGEVKQRSRFNVYVIEEGKRKLQMDVH